MLTPLSALLTSLSLPFMVDPSLVDRVTRLADCHVLAEPTVGNPFAAVRCQARVQCGDRESRHWCVMKLGGIINGRRVNRHWKCTYIVGRRRYVIRIGGYICLLSAERRTRAFDNMVARAWLQGLFLPK